MQSPRQFNTSYPSSPYLKVKIIERHRHPYKKFIFVCLIVTRVACFVAISALSEQSNRYSKKFIFIHKIIAIVSSSSLAEKIMIACLYALAKH